MHGGAKDTSIYSRDSVEIPKGEKDDAAEVEM